MSTRDRVPLSAYERRLLARLEAQAEDEDPSLAIRLRGRTWVHLLPRLRAWRLPTASPWMGAAGAVCGLIVTLVAAATWVWLGVVGIALLVAGGCGIAATVRERLEDSAGGARPSGSPRTPAEG